jgi:putative transposase
MKTRKIYYCTVAVRNGQPIFAADQNKHVLIRYMQSLYDRKRLRIYGYVIMPDHFHLLIEQLKPDPALDSLLASAGRALYTLLRCEQPLLLDEVVPLEEEDGCIWELPARTTQVTSMQEMLQYLQLMHNNPLSAHWRLCRTAADYTYSSSFYYQSGRDQFTMLSHYRDWVK